MAQGSGDVRSKYEVAGEIQDRFGFPVAAIGIVVGIAGSVIAIAPDLEKLGMMLMTGGVVQMVVPLIMMTLQELYDAPVREPRTLWDQYQIDQYRFGRWMEESEPVKEAKKASERLEKTDWRFWYLAYRDLLQDSQRLAAGYDNLKQYVERQIKDQQSPGNASAPLSGEFRGILREMQGDRSYERSLAERFRSEDK